MDKMYMLISVSMEL